MLHLELRQGLLREPLDVACDAHERQRRLVDLLLTAVQRWVVTVRSVSSSFFMPWKTSYTFFHFCANSWLVR